MLEFGKNHFYLYSPIAHWGFGLNFRQTGVALVWHPFYLKRTCFSRNIEEVLRFGKNLKKKKKKKKKEDNCEAFCVTCKRNINDLFFKYKQVP